MLNLIKRSTKPNLEQKRIAYTKKLFSAPYHFWLEENKTVKRGICILIEYFNDKIFQFLENSKNIAFLSVTSELGMCIVHDKEINIIVMFPSLIKRLKSAEPIGGIAVLAHELGHLYHNHHNRKISTIDAQIEADLFAYKLGLGKELYDILCDYKHLDEVIIRIKYLKQLLDNNSLKR